MARDMGTSLLLGPPSVFLIVASLMKRTGVTILLSKLTFSPVSNSLTIPINFLAHATAEDKD